MTERAPEDREALRASWGFPAFAEGFPADPDLDRLVSLFTAGDYRGVNEGADRLLAGDAEEPIKASARLLKERTRPDPAARVLLGLTLALLVLLTVYWVLHDGPGG